MDTILLSAVILLVLVLCYSAREKFTLNNYEKNNIKIWNIDREKIIKKSYFIAYAKNEEACKNRLIETTNFKSVAIKSKKNSKGEHQCIFTKLGAPYITGPESTAKNGYTIFTKEKGRVYPMSVLSDSDTLSIHSGMPSGNEGNKMCKQKCITTAGCTASVSIGENCILKRGEASADNILEGEVFLK